jgi:hypothetical protein
VWIVAEQVAVVGVPADLVHGASGEHVRDPGLVVGGVREHLAQRARLVRARHVEQWWQDAVHVLGPDQREGVHRGPIGELEHRCFVDHPSSSVVVGHDRRSDVGQLSAHIVEVFV